MAQRSPTVVLIAIVLQLLVGLLSAATLLLIYSLVFAWSLVPYVGGAIIGGLLLLLILALLAVILDGRTPPPPDTIPVDRPPEP